MKNIKLIALSFLTLSRLCFLWSEQNLQFAGGTKISTSFFEGCFYKNSAYENFNLAGSFSSKAINDNFPLVIKIGTLSYSGIISKINNPIISTSISPFGTASTKAVELTSAFPNYSSFSNPYSFSGSFGYNSKKSKVNYLNAAGFAKIDENFGVSSFAINFFEKIKFSSHNLSFSQIAAFSKYDEYIPDSWYSKNQISRKDFYYSAGNHINFLNQFSYENNFFSTLFTLGLYQNIFGNFPEFVYKSENKLNLKRSCFGFSLFLNPNKDFVFTSSEKKIENCFQTKISFQYKFLLPFFKGGFMKAGTAFYFDSPLYYTSEDELSQNLKNSFGVQFFSSEFRFTETLQIGSSILHQYKTIFYFGESGTLTLKGQLIFEKCQPSITGTLTYKKNETEAAISTSEKIVLAVSFCKKPEISVNSSLKTSQENLKQNSLDFSAAVSIRYSLDKISFVLKAADNF